MTALTEVIIDTAGPTVTIRAVGTLDEVAAKALELFTAAMLQYPVPKAITTVGFAASVERSTGPEYVTAHPVDLRSS